MKNPLSRALRELHWLTDAHSEKDLSDGELLTRFCRHGEPTAFSLLLHRHGPMVLGVCRRILGHAHDAEDAFQATFLVLVRKAASIRKQESLGSWLFGVACHIARRARLHKARRPIHQTGATDMAASKPADELCWQELRSVLDAEIEQLPEKYRAALVLCYLEGRTHEQGAGELGVPKSSLSSRVARARELRQRLVRCGITLSAAALAALLADKAGPAAVPAQLLLAAGEVARLGLAGALPRAGAISNRVLALAEGAVQGLFAAKLRVLMLVAFLGTMAAGASMLASPADLAPGLPDSPGKPQRENAKRVTGEPGKDNLGDPLPPRVLQRLGSTRLRPGGSVQLLAFSPDGTRLASWNVDTDSPSSLCIWEARTGRLRRRHALPGGNIRALTWLADGRGFALLETGEPAKGLLLWEFTAAGRAPKTVLPAGGGMAVVPGPAGAPQPWEGDSWYAISPDGKMLAIGREGEPDDSRPILLRQVKSGVRVEELPAPRRLARQPSSCGMLLFTPDGKTLVAFNKPKQRGGNQEEGRQLVVVWDAGTGKERVRFTAPRPAQNGYRPGVAVSECLLAIGMEDGSTSLWDLATGKERRLATGHDSKKPGQGHGTLAVAFTPDGKTLLTGGWDGLVKLWDVASGRNLRKLERQFAVVECLTVSRDGRAIASAGQDGRIRLWDSGTGADASPQPGHRYAVWKVALSRDGTIAVTAGWDDTLRWWDTTTGRQLRAVHVPESVEALAISPDGRTVLARIYEGGLRAWDLGSGRETTPPGLPGAGKGGIFSFTADGRRLVLATGAHVAVLDWPAMKLLRTWELAEPAQKPGETVCVGLAPSPEGRWLVTATERYWYREEKGLRRLRGRWRRGSVGPSHRQAGSPPGRGRGSLPIRHVYRRGPPAAVRRGGGNDPRSWGPSCGRDQGVHRSPGPARRPLAAGLCRAARPGGAPRGQASLHGSHPAFAGRPHPLRVVEPGCHCRL
jgi:RNA polymerase sigma factor (sigma-70 family)